MVLLPGSESKFEWQSDPGAREPGLVAFADMPQMGRDDYVFNANDSFWVANAAELLEGDFSPLHGLTNSPLSLRTRNNALTLSHRSADRAAGQDQKFDLDEVWRAVLSNRSYAADLLKPQCANVLVLVAQQADHQVDQIVTRFLLGKRRRDQRKCEDCAR